MLFQDFKNKLSVTAGGLEEHSDVASKPRRRRRDHRASAMVLVGVGLALSLSSCGGSDATAPADGSGPAQKASSAGPSCDCLDEVVEDAAAVALLPEDIKAAGVLKAGFNAPSPPFWYIDTNGSTTYSGVEYDMIQALGKSLGLKVELTNQAWDGLMPALTAERYDVIISNIGDKPERRKNINFVDYGKTGTGLLVLDKNKDKYEAKTDMCGSTIGAQSGSAQVTLLQQISDSECAGAQPITIKALSDLKGLFPALISGQIDSMALDSPAVYYWAGLKQTGATKYAAVLSDLQDPLMYGIGVNNKNPELTEAVQAALKGLGDSGVYQKIWDTGNIGDLTLTEFTINGQPSL